MRVKGPKSTELIYVDVLIINFKVVRNFKKKSHRRKTKESPIQKNLKHINMQTITEVRDRVTETVKPVLNTAIEKTTPVLTSAIERAIEVVERIDPEASNREAYFGSQQSPATGSV